MKLDTFNIQWLLKNTQWPTQHLVSDERSFRSLVWNPNKGMPTVAHGSPNAAAVALWLI